MYVCICNAVTDQAIREAAANGVHSFAELQRRTGCSDCCGNCAEMASEIFREAVSARTLGLPLLAHAA